MNTTELRTQDEAGLAKEIKDLQRAHFNLRMQKATQQIGNTNQLRRHFRQPETFATRFSAVEGGDLGAKLPLDQRHFASGQQCD